MINNATLFGLIMLVAGVGIPIMAALNSGLGARIGSPVFAALVLFVVSLLVTGVIAAMNPVPSKAVLLDLPPQYFLGGLLCAFYVLTMTWIAPKIGVGNAVFLVLLGQIVTAAVIDNFGLFGSPKFPVDSTRIIGVVVMIVGVILARRPTTD